MGGLREECAKVIGVCCSKNCRSFTVVNAVAGLLCLLLGVFMMYLCSWSDLFRIADCWYIEGLHN